MSFPLQRTARVAATVLIAGTLVLASSAHAGATSEQQCHAAKSKVAGQYYACLQKASAKLATSLDAATFNGAVTSCNAKYDAAWEKQDGKAAASGTACLDGGTTDLAFRTVIAANWATVQGALATGGPIPDCGNATVEAPEACDGSNLGGAACATLAGFVDGTLRCASDCTFDTSECWAQRFVDNLDGTVTDNQTGLQWEKKDAAGGGQNFANPHDVDNVYIYASSFPLSEPNGTLFTDFLDRLNCTSGDGAVVTAGFAGRCDWRLPTAAELQTILSACATSPCIDPTFGPTHPERYWSSTIFSSNPEWDWVVSFADGGVFPIGNGSGLLARAVRSGS